MATMQETPSRIWRRIEAIEDHDMPSLPSLPAFDDSIEDIQSSSVAPAPDAEAEDTDASLDRILTPIHSTPTVSSHHASTRAASSTSSAQRFANSIARSGRSSVTGSSNSRGRSTRPTLPDSFDVSAIPSLPDVPQERGTGHYSSDEEDMAQSKSSVPEMYLPPQEGIREGIRDFSLADALESVSRAGSPSEELEGTPKGHFDYFVKLRSEPKPSPKASPFDKFRNVALRRPLARARTPSLTRTNASSATSSTNSTPHSTRSIISNRLQSESPLPPASIPLPSSNAGSPAIVVHSADGEEAFQVGDESSIHDTTRSMDITDAHISPLREFRAEEQDTESQSEAEEQDSAASQDEREPTFSSDEQTPYAQNNSDRHRSPTALSSAFSSPAFTPTPAFPRPRPRFNPAGPAFDLPTTPAPRPDEDEPVTPHTRRRDFLLSVINSTARPRLKFPTPHPRNKLAFPDTPGITDTDTESTPGPSNGVGTLQTAFAGATPRPRIMAGGRRSHPLAQAHHAASPGTSDSESISAGTASAGRRLSQPWATPAAASQSPYDGASFISTASSHDLTTHPRANTSFDPAMGFGVGAQGGVGRFNAGKLNSYLHGLNRRLQEENEALVERLRKVEEEKEKKGEVGNLSVVSSAGAGRRLSAGGAKRRVSAGGTDLGNVKEDVGGEGWMEEKAELEEMVEVFKEEAAKYMEEKAEAEKALDEERQERARDKERWKQRMSEVEKGVQTIVEDLERKMQDAESRAKVAEDAGVERVKGLEKKLVEAEGDRDLATQRAEKSERALESGKELGGELNIANERVSKVMGDLRNANAQIKELEDEVLRSDARIDELEKDLNEEKVLSKDLETELHVKLDELEAQDGKLQQMEEIVGKTQQELEAANAYIAELEGDGTAAVERIESLEDEVATAYEQIQQLKASEDEQHEKMEALEKDTERSAELARQMEEALEAAEQKMMADEEKIAELRVKVSSLEREKERHIEAANRSQDPSVQVPQGGATEAELDALESELDEAHKEIARLNTVLHQSPARKAMDKAKDTQIEILEKENEELVERIKILRMTVAETGTPSRIINNSGISPIHRQVLSMSMRAPRTPGAPLKDMSWLNATGVDQSGSPLVAEISRLQRELDRANESIDDKLDKLEDAGSGVVGLTRKLEDARAKIVSLEDEIARLSRREDRRTRRLERARCKKCLTKVDTRALNAALEGDESSMDLSKSCLPTEPPTPPTKTSEALRANLQNVNSNLSSMKKQWEEEKSRLLGEKAVLQDAANLLNVQVRTAKEEASKGSELQKAGQKLRSGVEADLNKAKSTITELEGELRAERARLRAMAAEQNRVKRETQDVLDQLQRTESDMNDVKEQLQKHKKDNHEMETELRHNSNAEQKVRLMEVRVAENAETIEQLREERSLLASDHKALQKRFSEISEHANHLRDEYTTSQTSHDNRRHQLDLHLAEIDDLRRALSDKAEELHRTEAEKDRISAEKSDVARTVAALEADLKRVRRDAEAFGHDLKLLRAEKERVEAKQKEELSRAERNKKQAQTQLRLLNEQLDAQRSKTQRAKEELENHVCAMDKKQLSAIQLQHNKECKGLIVQIRYLKAKFTRESTLRFDLVFQKQYLMVLLSRFEKSEQTIFAAIAKIGFPVLPPVPPVKERKKLKSVAQCVVFLARVKRASDLWREQRSSKPAITAALQEVRRRREIVS